MRYFNVGIDRIAMTADITLKTAQIILEKLLDSEDSTLFRANSLNDSSFSIEKFANFKGSLFCNHDYINESDCDFSGIFVDFDIARSERQHQRNFRFEYNPTKISGAAAKFLDQYIYIDLANNRHTHLDIAFDVDEDLSQYHFEHNFQVTTERKVGNQLQSIYLGSEKSRKMIRIYDKKKERLAKGFPLDFETEHLWRIEFVLRGEEAMRFVTDSDYQLFELLKLKKDFDLSEFSGMRYLALKSILDDETNIKKLSKNMQTEYRKIIKNLKCTDLTPYLAEFWRQKKLSILSELKANLK